MANILWRCYKVYRLLHSSLEWNLCRVFTYKAIGHSGRQTSDEPHSCLFRSRRKHFNAPAWGGCDVVCLARLVSDYLAIFWKELRAIRRVEALLLWLESLHFQQTKPLPTGRTTTPGFAPSPGDAARAISSLACTKFFSFELVMPPICTNAKRNGLNGGALFADRVAIARYGTNPM